MNQEQILQLIGFLIFLAILIPFIMPLIQMMLGFMGNQFCSSSVQVKSLFNNMFLGAFGRAVIPDKIFEMVPLVCHSDVVIEEESIEETLAQEIIQCYEQFGAGTLNGVFPDNSFLCSAVVYDGELGEEAEAVDLMQVYSILMNDPDFNLNLEVDLIEPEQNLLQSKSLDYNNPFRFCLYPTYQLNILENMMDFNTELFNNNWDESDEISELTNFDQADDVIQLVRETNGVCWGYAGLEEDTAYLYGESCWHPLVENEREWWMHEIENAGMNNRNSCFSLREASLNDWQLNLMAESVNYDNDEDLLKFCNDMCRRKCEYEYDTLDEYNACTQICFTSCQGCTRTACSEFTNDLYGLFKPISGKPPVGEGSEGNNYIGFESATYLKRGVFYIRFFDYTDWLQEKTSDWHYFPECENNIILLNEVTGADAGRMQSSSIKDAIAAKKHDYVSICYLPYVPFELIHPSETGGYGDTLVSVT